MRRARKRLFLLGWAVALCTLAFVLLFGFTPLKQTLYQPFLYDAMGDMGYEVLSASKSDGRTVLQFKIPEGQTLDEARFREIYAAAHEQAQERFVSTLRWAGIAGISFGMLCFLVSEALAQLDKRKKRVPTKKKRRPKISSAPVAATKRQEPVPQPVLALSVQPPPTWEDMLAEVRKQLPRIQDLRQRQAFEVRLHQLEKERRKRLSKLQHLLWQVTSVIDQKGTKSVLSKSATERAVPTPRQGPGIAELLPIDEVIPSDLNPALVKAILMHGFLRPGNRKRYLNKGYTPIEEVKRRVPFSASEVEEGLAWLVKVGVVWSRKKQGVEVLSCNIHMDGAGEPGNTIIVAVRRAARHLTTFQ